MSHAAASFFVAGVAAGTEEFGDAELGVHVLAEAAEIGILAQKAGEAAAGGMILGPEVGGDATVGRSMREEPFKREAFVEGEDLAEALGEFLVAHDGVVADGDAVVAEPAFDAAVAGDDVFVCTCVCVFVGPTAQTNLECSLLKQVY